MIRIFNFFFFNEVIQVLIWLSCLGIAIVGVICRKINDIKSLIAYSSVSHISIALLGVYRFLKSGTLGCIFLLLRHGICSSGIFFFIGVIYSFRKRRSLIINKGLLNLRKGLTILIFLIYMPNIAIPLTMNLFAEIYLLLTIISFSSTSLILLLLGIFLVAYFTVLVFSSIIHGLPSSRLKTNLRLKFDFFIVSVAHIFLLNISFLFINLFCLFSLFKIKDCGALEDFNQ